MLRTVILLNKLHKIHYCTKSGKSNTLYSSTVFLPKTEFALRLQGKNLTQRDEKIASADSFQQLYVWQRSHLSEPEFVLHDGPPYANGELHMGHAINKILKDTILRHHMINGNKVHYVPGWDCHGLPIELKAGSGSTPVETRSKARSFAKTTIEKQKQAFQSWGIVGDWANFYSTYNPDYVKLQFKIFYKLYKRNLIYKGVKPVYWSPSTRTALAEAELEYNEKHISPSVYVRFKIKGASDHDNMFALIWTTTPWTLPANQAVCYSPSLQYSLVRKTGDDSIYIVASDSIENLSKVLSSNFEVVETISGETLSKYTYLHPVFQREQKFLPGSHVSSGKGTGLVHTAPAHGPDDFTLALNNKLEINNLVDDSGCYNVEAGKQLEGKFVLKEGTEAVLKIIKNDLVHMEDFVHSYPYDWRTKKPVIIRATQQWFIDTGAIKDRAVELLEDVKFFPKVSSEIYKRNLVSQIQKRPYWCISRQRKWGVPIPVFQNKFTNEVFLEEDCISHFCELIDKHGTDFWWTLPTKEMFPSHLLETINPDEFERGQDILDIWFDSGISWANALDGDKVADMYLEGVDQFNGWFQSSLITSVALRDKAPYKSLYVHGHAVDERGNKMSKSLGNVMDPLKVLKGSKGKNPLGIDTLRWWVACHTNQDSLNHINDNVLQASSDEVQKIRSVLRFILGSLQDYKHSDPSYENLSLLDKYILDLLFHFQRQVQEDAKEYLFNRIGVSVINFLTNSVSALYFTAIKDRLYCDALDSVERQASQFVLFQIYETVTQAIAPIIPHMVEEMHGYLSLKTGQSYFMTSHSKAWPSWKNETVSKVLQVVLDIKKDINREAGSDTTGLSVEIGFSSGIWQDIQTLNLKDLEAELEDILQVAEVTADLASPSPDVDYVLKTSKSSKFSCARCRRVQSDIENELCRRCSAVIKNLDCEKVVAN